MSRPVPRSLPGPGSNAVPCGSLEDAYASRASMIPGSVIDDGVGQLQPAHPGLISFAMGSPPADALPRNLFRDAAQRVLGDPKATALGYAPTEGDYPLREALLDCLEARGGGAPEPDELLITAGGMQGLDLVCKLFLGPGDLAVVESPTYTNGTATISSYEAPVLEVPVDEHGMVVERIPELLEGVTQTPKLFYVIPNFQNPTGQTLSVDRRLHLLELAAEYGAVVLEDDPYGWLGFDGSELPSLWSLAGDRKNVVAVHTFSKILAPGFRVGWLLAPAPVLKRLVAAKQGVDTCTNVLGQRIIAEFLNTGLLDVHIERLRPSFRERKRAMQDALAEFFGGITGCHWTDPDGGLFLWLALPEGTHGNELAARARAERLAIVPGSAFSPSGLFSDATRLCFSYADAAEIREGVRRLRLSFDAVAGDRYGGTSTGASAHQVPRVVA